MTNYVQSILQVGGHGIVIQIECQLSNGLPSIVIVGLGNKAVDEAKERIRSAFASTSLSLPKKRITINLAPADIPKDSTGFDLPIAAAILQANQQCVAFTRDQALIGEIGLDGSVRPVRGIIGQVIAGKQAGITTFFIPAPNVKQAMLVPNIKIVSVKSVQDLCRQNDTPLIYAKPVRSGPEESVVPDTPCLDDIIGQQTAKRTLEIAAAGSHNLLLYGPPGTGKSMLAKTLASLLPPPSHNEVLEITHLHSLASHNYDALITTRPFRSPHSNSSQSALLGGGALGKPGEISLSHRGILFLDELPEFGRITLDALRQPLEDRCITISRLRHTATYPAHFLLVATANPCPCGFYGTGKPCSCSPARILQYQQRLSGPILDRIDLHVAVDTVAYEQLLTNRRPDSTTDIVRQRVLSARLLQEKRYGPTGKANSDMSNADVKQYAKLEKNAISLLTTAAERLGISARGYMKAIKIARTIADLDGAQTVTVAHVSEALQYRPNSPKI